MLSSLDRSAIDACNISHHYAAMYQSISEVQRTTYSPAGDSISIALFYHLAKMKYAGWIHRVKFARARKHAMADIFQDLLAFYLRCALTEEYEVLLEACAGERKARTQADILVRKNGRNHFVIEVKTTIGFARPDYTLDEPYALLAERIDRVAANFGVPQAHVLYVFEEPSNVGKQFLELFWDKKQGRAVDRCALPSPLSHIYPLFWETDPYYWKWPKAARSGWAESYPVLNDEQILEEARRRIVTRFETVVERILGAVPC